MSNCPMKVAAALGFTVGVVAGAAVHTCCCANMTREQQRNMTRCSRRLIRGAKHKMEHMHF